MLHERLYTLSDEENAMPMVRVVGYWEHVYAFWTGVLEAGTTTRGVSRLSSREDDRRTSQVDDSAPGTMADAERGWSWKSMASLAMELAPT